MVSPPSTLISDLLHFLELPRNCPVDADPESDGGWKLEIKGMTYRFPRRAILTKGSRWWGWAGPCLSGHSIARLITFERSMERLSVLKKKEDADTGRSSPP